MRIAVVSGLALVLALAMLPAAADACPPGTVFSAFDGKGLCLHKGRGRSVAARCASTGSVENCPPGYDLRRKATDPDHAYCCPQRLARASPSCETQCRPLLESITPRSEANRVYQNCILGCVGSDEFFCPDGRRVRTGSSC